MSEADFPRDLSELVGDYDKSTSSVGYNKGVRSTNHQLSRERILDASELAALPRGRAVMLSSGSPAALIETVPWMKGKHAPAIRASIAAHDPAGLASMNSDFLASVESEAAFDRAPYLIDTTLKDDDERGGLFGFRFDSSSSDSASEFEPDDVPEEQIISID